jgi:hypothetical protein
MSATTATDGRGNLFPNLAGDPRTDCSRLCRGGSAAKGFQAVKLAPQTPDPMEPSGRPTPESGRDACIQSRVRSQNHRRQGPFVDGPRRSSMFTGRSCPIRACGRTDAIFPKRRHRRLSSPVCWRHTRDESLKHGLGSAPRHARESLSSTRVLAGDSTRVPRPCPRRRHPPMSPDAECSCASIDKPGLLRNLDPLNSRSR